ncbi:Uncharacterized protein Adt_14292 [Abeliophyllum distichum]|uniref:Uncharacterized protein n=1 Tax=Abeliophyllum distichum TaxID=126358 RepID=A0ABD1U098_9LAMI
MHPFFCEVLKDWTLAPCQITPNDWGQMVASYLLWVVAEAGGILTPGEFESIYRPCRSSGWYNVSPRSGQKWRTDIDSPNKVHNWKERFFFVDGDWELIPEDPLPHVTISRRFGELDCRKPRIPKRNQGKLRSNWDKVRALSSEFRSLNNLLKDDNLLASCGLMVGRVLRHKLLCKKRRVHHKRPRTSFLLYVPRSTLMFPRVRLRPPTFTLTPPLRGTKGRRFLKGTEEAPSQKRKAPTAMEGLIRYAHKARRTEEGRWSSPSLDGEPEGARNFASSAGQNHRIRISKRRKELPASVMEMLPTHPSIVAASVHRYWTSSWEKVAEEATIFEQLKLAEVNLVRGLVLAKDIFSAFTSFDAEDFKSKKLAKDLKVMGLEKAQMESDKRALQFKLDLVVSKEADMKAKYEIAKECLKQDRTLVAETALAAANNSLEAAAADNERSFSATKLELEKIKTERVEARVVEAYQDAFVDTPEYQDFVQRLMTVDREQLVERIMEAHLERDISFLREPPVEAHVSEANPGDAHGGDEGPSCADP